MLNEREIERVVEFLEENNCEDVCLGMNLEEGTTISYVFTSTDHWNNQFQCCEIVIKDIEELPSALQNVADDFDINQKIVDMVLATKGEGIHIAELVELNQDLHQEMETLAEKSEEFLEEYEDEE